MTNTAVSTGFPVLERAVVIVHERAPSAGAGNWKDLIRESLGPDALIREVRVTTFDEAREAAARAAADRVDVVIAVGGDGTVNACVNGLGDSRTRLAVLPAGTANDVARQIGQKRDPRREAGTLHRWKKRTMDSVTVNGAQYCSVGGMGWVADAANLANRWRSKSRIIRALVTRVGSLIYSLAAMFVILSWRRRLDAHYRISYLDADDECEKTLELSCYALFVANFRSLGNSFTLSESSQPGDGIVELVVVPRTNRLRLIRGVIAAARGKLYQTMPEVKLIRIRRATIETDRPMSFFGDGETLVHDQRRIEVSLAAWPLRMIGPQSTRFSPLTSETPA